MSSCLPPSPARFSVNPPPPLIFGFGALHPPLTLSRAPPDVPRQPPTPSTHPAGLLSGKPQTTIAWRILGSTAPIAEGVTRDNAHRIWMRRNRGSTASIQSCGMLKKLKHALLDEFKVKKIDQVNNQISHARFLLGDAAKSPLT